MLREGDGLLRARFEKKANTGMNINTTSKNSRLPFVT